MKEIIENNAEIGRQEFKRYIRIKQRKEKLLSVFIGSFIVIATCSLLILNSRLTDNAKKSCIEAGHSENYCNARI